MSDLRRLCMGSDDGDDVETYAGMDLIGFHKSIGGNDDRPYLLWRDGQRGIAKAFVAPRLHLHDHQEVFVLLLGDEVKVAMSTMPVAKEYLEALTLQVAGSQFFASTSQLIVRSHTLSYSFVR